MGQFSKRERFTLFQQQLIETRDQLDRKVEQLTLIYKFCQQALSLGSRDELMTLACESAVDIFESEFALFFEFETGSRQLISLAQFGCLFNEDDIIALQNLFVNHTINNTKVGLLTSEQLGSPLTSIALDNVLFFVCGSQEEKKNALLIIGTTQKKSSIYPVQQEHSGEALAVLGSQLWAMLLNLYNQNEVVRQAYLDSLTDLPNRLSIQNTLADMIDNASRKGEEFAVLFIDLDNFKKVNDSLGHEAGDIVLIEAAKRLKSCIRNKDNIGRLGGDEFLITIQDSNCREVCKKILQRILERFRESMVVPNKKVNMTLSIGISIYPDNGKFRSDLLRNADIAMYDAKSKGRNTYSFFDKRMNSEFFRRIQLEELMQVGLKQQEFEVYFQPQICLQTGKLVGAEALLRWNSKVLGSVSPAEFIPVAEQTALIVPLGYFVLAESLKQASHWVKLNPNFRVSINLSPRQLDDDNFYDELVKLVNEFKFPVSSIVLEITEGTLLSAVASTKEKLQKLTDLGVLLAMDDFGTGYSSLSYLRKYPFSILKIDRSFISDMVHDSSGNELVKAIISMAKTLNMTVVAEGIENQQQQQLLLNHGCDEGQGFLISKPVSSSAFTHYIEEKLVK